MPLSSFSSVTAEKNSPLERSRGRIHLIGGDFYYSPNSWRDRALWLVMGMGHPRAKFFQPTLVPAETRTHFYGCGIPVLTGAGLKGPMGMKTHMGLGVQNASQMHTRRQLTLVHLLRGYCTYRGVLTMRMILIVVCSYQNKRSTLSAINDDK